MSMRDCRHRPVGTLAQAHRAPYVSGAMEGGPVFHPAGRPRDGRVPACRSGPTFY